MSVRKRREKEKWKRNGKNEQERENGKESGRNVPLLIYLLL